MFSPGVNTAADVFLKPDEATHAGSLFWHERRALS
jgi:hypothetical protein